MPVPAGNRRGIVLAVALLVIVVIGALVAGAAFATMQEYRISQNALAAQRAFGAAEAGLNGVLARWGAGGWDTLSVAAPGDDTSYTVATAGGDEAAVTITRLTGSTLWVVSEGVAEAGDAARRATRRTNLVLRVRGDTLYPVAQRAWAQLF
jgi:hypothetical protein